jgi:hypothetical protein
MLNTAELATGSAETLHEPRRVVDEAVAARGAFS